MKNLKNNYTHRLAMIQDELKALREFIQSNNELESKFGEPSVYCNNGAITHLNNIEIACSLEDSECLHWKPYTSTPKKKIFRIDITRTEYQGRVFYIEAETIEEAEALALEQAPDEIFDTDADADYEVFYSEEINN